MHRTQIYLQPDLNDALERLARKRGTSKAEVLRLAARRFVQQEQTSEEDPILGIIALGQSEPGRVSEEHDRFLAEHGLAHGST